jgi:two-component system, NarL family, response regulator LiaR
MEPAGRTAEAVKTQLTPREFEVAILMAHGYTNQEVADRLVISVRTAESHRQNLMAKLSARSRADVVRWALDHQLLR